MIQVDSGRKLRIGISLSGGAARGIAHIGVLKALEEYGIEPDEVSGASMGAIVGLMYAAGVPLDQMQALLKDKIYSVFSFNLFKNGLLSLHPLMDIFKEAIPKNDFSILKKPFFVAVANLNTGRGEIISSGDHLFEYVIASSSIPFVFSSQQIDSQTYVDGGLYNNMPSEPLVGHCDRIIGVNVNANGIVDKVEGIKQIAERTFQLALDQNVKQSRNYCDYYIEPQKISDYTWWDFNKVDELVEVGYQQAVKVIKQFIIPDLWPKV